MSSALLADLPPVQRLALAYASSRSRPAILSLLALDARLAAILRGRREPIAAQMRLAWWRDMLARPKSEWPAGEPVLEALCAWNDPGGLAALAEGWEALLAEDLIPATIAEFVDGRAQAFACEPCMCILVLAPMPIPGGISAAPPAPRSTCRSTSYVWP